MAFPEFENYVTNQTFSSSPAVAPHSTNSGDSAVPQKRDVIDLVSSDEEPAQKPRTLEDYWTPTKKTKHLTVQDYTSSVSPKSNRNARPSFKNVPILKSSPQKRSGIPRLRVTKSSPKLDQSPRKNSMLDLWTNVIPSSSHSLPALEKNSNPELTSKSKVASSHSLPVLENSSELTSKSRGTSSHSLPAIENNLERTSKPKEILKLEIPVSHSSAQNLRAHFKKNLSRLTGPPVNLVNDHDDSSPPVSFEFINNSIICAGVEVADEGFMVGCDCQHKIGGCKPHQCSCIQQVEVSDDGLRAPYKTREPRLQDHHLATRKHIYECNKNCNCGDDCGNRLVQHGRTVPLTIFKTKSRGWGLRCPVALKKGQFIDTYRGEVITSKEVNRRSENLAPGLNYFFDLDHFTSQWITPLALKDAVSSAKYEEIKDLVASGNWETEKIGGEIRWTNPQWSNRYVCDGQTFGGPTRFMNHSCQPNCRIFTVSYNHADQNLYEIAFFALRDIAPNKELTFDYNDVEDPQVISDEMADEMEEKNGYRPARCLCQSKKCRGYFFQ